MDITKVDLWKNGLFCSRYLFKNANCSPHEEKFVPQIWDDARTFHFFFSGKNGAPSLVLRDKGFFRAEYKDL